MRSTIPARRRPSGTTCGGRRPPTTRSSRTPPAWINAELRRAAGADLRTGQGAGRRRRHRRLLPDRRRVDGAVPAVADGLLATGGITDRRRHLHPARPPLQRPRHGPERRRRHHPRAALTCATHLADPPTSGAHHDDHRTPPRAARRAPARRPHRRRDPRRRHQPAARRRHHRRHPHDVAALEGRVLPRPAARPRQPRPLRPRVRRPDAGPPAVRRHRRPRPPRGVPGVQGPLRRRATTHAGSTTSSGTPTSPRR